MKLLALRCPNCTRPVSAHNDHVLIACDNCHTVLSLSEEQGLAVVKVSYAAPQGEATAWLPLWLFPGRVIIRRREAQRGSDDKAAIAFWDQPRYFYVPAWDTNIQTWRTIGRELVKQQPQFQAVSRPETAHLRPAFLTAQDAQKIIEFIVLDIEVGRSDWLKNLDFSLEVSQPTLWAVPAGGGPEQWQLRMTNNKL